jgi:hypothetical protein
VALAERQAHQACRFVEEHAVAMAVKGIPSGIGQRYPHPQTTQAQSRCGGNDRENALK